MDQEVVSYEVFLDTAAILQSLDSPLLLPSSGVRPSIGRQEGNTEPRSGATGGQVLAG